MNKKRIRIFKYKYKASKPKVPYYWLADKDNNINGIIYHYKSKIEIIIIIILFFFSIFYGII